MDDISMTIEERIRGCKSIDETLNLLESRLKLGYISILDISIGIGGCQTYPLCIEADHAYAKPLFDWFRQWVAGYKLSLQANGSHYKQTLDQDEESQPFITEAPEWSKKGQ